jgi:hypothetical protein
MGYIAGASLKKERGRKEGGKKRGREGKKKERRKNIITFYFKT